MTKQRVECGWRGRLARAMVLLGAWAVAAWAYGADPNPPAIRSAQGAWPIRRQWNVAETQHYAQWFENIYAMKTKGNVDQRTAKLTRILTDPEMNLLLQPEFAGEGANPQLSGGTIVYLHAVVDCAKLTAALPAYYAYRRALPWMTSYVTSGDRGVDVRIATHTIPVGFENSFTCPSADMFFRNAVGGYISGNYRVEPGCLHWDWSDTVPVALNRQFLMPGCINYTDGHCLILAQVDKYGELHFLNASTADTKDIFTYNGMNTVAGLEPMHREDPANLLKGCFQGLRVPRYPIAETNAQGVVTKVRRRTDREMEEFGMSYEEYDKVADMYENHCIVENGLKFGSFHELIRFRMKSVDQVVPLEFMRGYIEEMTEMYQERERFVQDAWHDVLQNGGIVYPEDRDKDNIFQATGRWETWSSPSSNVDRRTKYFYLADWLDNAITWYASMPQFVDLAGLEGYDIHSQEDLAIAFIKEKRKLFKEKEIFYTNCAGQKVRLTLEDIETRLYDLSYDPNHPPELRWGAPEGGPERATAKEMFTPLPDGSRMPMLDAYRLEIFYRTVCQRETCTSYLRTMFTAGFPVRPKFDHQLTRWLSDERAEAFKKESAPHE